MSNNNLKRVVILLGADQYSPRIDEQEGHVQAQAIARGFERLGLKSEIIRVGADFNSLRKLVNIKPFFVINLVEELEGQCRLAHLVPAMLEVLNLRFSGSSALSYALTTDKIQTKKLLNLAGLSTPSWSTDGLDLSGEDRVIIKSVHEDASFGIDENSVMPASQAAQALKVKSQAHGGQWFAEKYIDGREFNVSLLYINQELRVLPIAELVFDNYPGSKPKIIDYDAKWDENSFAYKNTARNFLDNNNTLAQELSRLAVAAWNLLGLKDYARIDFRVDTQGLCYILEANANPSLAPDSGFVASAKQAGIEFDQLLYSLLPKEADKNYNKYIIDYSSEVQASDIIDLRSILARSGFFTDEEVCVAIELLEEGLNNKASSYKFIIAKSSLQVLGYACYGRIMSTKDRYDLYWLAVEPDLRRQGLGRVLLQKVEESIKAALGQRLYVQTSGKKLYEPTLDFYRASGYEQVSKLTDYYGPGDNQIVFMKEF